MASSAAGAEVKRVLIIHSFGRATPPFATQSTAFQTTLTKELRESVEIDEVSLDMASYGQPRLEGPFVEFLRARLSTWQPDLVIPVGAPAGQFVVKYRDHLFPRAPIIYTAMDRRTLPPDAFQNNATFVGDSFDLPGLFEDILQLAPGTKNIAVVVGASPIERFWGKALHDAAEPFTTSVRFTWLDKSFDETLRQVAAMPPQSFILLGLLLRDASGVSHNQDNVLQRLHAVANAPIVGVFQNQLGLGVVGGRLYQTDAAGTASARIAIRILRGEPISKFPPRALSVLSPRYDWRELQRWNISEDRLPAGSVIEFRQSTVWQRYRWQMIGAITVIGLQAVLLAGLLVQTRRRNRVEATLRDRLGFETLVSGLSATFAKLRGADVDRGIEDSLRRVGEHLGVDRATITQRVRGSDAIESIHVWRRPGGPTAPLPMRRADLPWTAERIRSGQLLRFSRLGDLPAEAAVDRETFARIGITSGLGLPLITGAATMGALTLGHLGGEREWPADLVQRLEFVAGIFSSAMLRGHTEVELEKLRYNLSHVGRVSAMAELAASLAHELRQPLTAILSNAQAARRMLDRGVDTKDLREILSDIVADDQRASELIRQVRAFIRKDTTPRSPVDLNALVEDVVSLLRNDAVVRNVTLEVDLGPGLPPVHVDRVQFQQVLVNLLMNAFDALGNASERRTIVTTRKAGTAIHVSVKDSGGGIPVADLARIFDPFYTTKSSGLGMGLSIARSLIEAHGGQLWAENNKDGGATFILTVPVTEDHDG
jgi:signal transduction histidine kinase